MTKPSVLASIAAALIAVSVTLAGPAAAAGAGGHDRPRSLEQSAPAATTTIADTTAH